MESLRYLALRCEAAEGGVSQCWAKKIYAAKIVSFQNFHFLGNFDSLWLLTVDDVDVVL